jgi:LysM domain
VRRGSGVVVRRRWAWPVATAAGLVLVGRVLVGDVGAPPRLLRTLGDLGDPWADSVVAMISLLALLVETLVAYLLVVLALRSLWLLPGPVGRVAGRVTLLVTPVVVRRLLDLLVGGALLAQATLAATSGMPSGRRVAVPALTVAISSGSDGPAAPVTAYDLGPPGIGPAPPHGAVTDPVETRPAPRRSAAPLPPWLGGWPSNPTRRAAADAEPGSAGEAGAGYTVAVGDTLWDIAAARLTPRERTVLNVHRYWRQVYRANRRAIGADPDLIHPGTRLDVPPFRRDRR